MSQRFRDKQGIAYPQGGMPTIIPQKDDSNVIEGYEAYDPTLSDYPFPSGVAKPIGTDDLLLNSSAEIPGPHEMFHAGDISNSRAYAASGIANIRDNVDWEVGGVSGLVNNFPYSMGVVSSDLVEDFGMRGQQAIIRRQRNPAEQGAVGTADYNAMLSLAYAQAAANYYPNEASQGNLVQAV